MRPGASSPAKADSLPWGGPCTRPLRGFIQFASPLWLPRVQAADGAAAVPAQMLGSAPAPGPSPIPSTLPRHLGKPEFPDTGWDRVKDLFDRTEMQAFPEELSSLVKSGLAAAVAGLVYGGLPAARHARERFIQNSQAEMYTSRMDAVRSAHNAAIRGFVRYGWRWSWRVAAFVTLFNSVSTGISVYRDKYWISHYAAAGAVTGGLFRLNLGLGGILAGSAIGAVMGLPAGVLILGLQKMTGETGRERRRRERRELYDLKLSEWAARLQLTDDLIGDLKADCGEEAERNLEKIDKLLSLPRNEGSAQDSR